LTIARTAGAEPTDDSRKVAHEAYEQGKAAFLAHDYLRAGKLFLEAYARVPHHDPLWNAARAFELGGDRARAANLYARYLDEAPPAARDRDRATAAKKDLAAELGRIDILARGVTDVRIDGDPAPGASVYVEPGEHALLARAGNAEVRAVRVVGAGAALSVVLEPAPPPAAPAPTPSPPPQRGTRVLPPALVYVGAGVTAVGLGATIASGVDTLNAKRHYDAAPSSDLLDSGRSKETRTNVLFWTTIGLAAITGACAIWLVEWRAGDARVRASIGGLEGAF
jgi:hypothetical protein